MAVAWEVRTGGMAWHQRCNAHMHARACATAVRGGGAGVRRCPCTRARELLGAVSTCLVYCRRRRHMASAGDVVADNASVTRPAHAHASVGALRGSLRDRSVRVRPRASACVR